MSKCCVGNCFSFCNTGINVLILGIIIMAVLAILFFVARRLGFARKKARKQRNIENSYAGQEDTIPNTSNAPNTNYDNLQLEQKVLEKLNNFDSKQ